MTSTHHPLDDIVDSGDDPPDGPSTHDEDNSIDKKGARPDTTIRKFEKDYIGYSVVKMKLNSFIRRVTAGDVRVSKQRKGDIPCNNPAWFHFINGIVQKMNLIHFHVAHLVNLHFLRLLENGLDLPEVITNHTFYQACAYVSTCRGALTPPATDDPWYETWLLYSTSLGDGYQWPTRDYCCNIISYMSATMYENTANHFNLNWRKRLYKHLRTVTGEKEGGKIAYWVARIHDTLYVDPEKGNKFDNDPSSEVLIKEYREKYQHEGMGFKIFQNYRVFLPHYYEMLKTAEVGEQKRFTLFPEKGAYVPAHITIDSTCLGELIALYTGQAIDRKAVKARSQWDCFFNLKKVNAKGTFFGNIITTNGYDVSITTRHVTGGIPPYDLFLATPEEKIVIIGGIMAERKAQAAARAAKKELDRLNGVKEKKVKPVVDKPVITDWDRYSNHLGLDPGKRSLYTTRDDKGAHKQCRAREYHHLIGLKQYRHQLGLNRRKTSIKELDSIVANNSFKVTTVARYIASIVQIVQILPRLQEEYGRLFYRKYKFLSYGKKRKAYKQIYERLVAGESGPVLVGYGAGLCNGTGIKGASVPVISFYNYLQLQDPVKIKTIKVNENYTTKMCYKCHNVTGCVHQYRDINTSEKKVERKKVLIYGLRRCLNNECRITWDRDKNASSNIHTVLSTEYRKDGIRPQYLCPAPKKPSKKQATKASVGTDPATNVSMRAIVGESKKKIKIDIRHKNMPGKPDVIVGDSPVQT